MALYDQNPTGRFADRASDYAKYRPSYPGEALGAILLGLGRPSRLVAADVGAGTGISSRLLAEHGVRVLAIEPSAAMRAAAAHNERVTFRDGTAEETGLADESVDLVLCAQAFHWFRPREAFAEFARILKPGGRVALMWNDRDDRDECTRRYGELILTASDGHAAARGFAPPDALRDSALFTGYRAQAFSSHQDLDEAGLIGRAASASYVPKSGEKWEALQRGLRAHFAQFAGPATIAAPPTVRLLYRTSVYLAERHPAEPANVRSPS